MDNAILELARVQGQGRRALLATVVKGVGPTYRKPGAAAVIVEGGQVIGAISGGCLESDVIYAAERVLAGQDPARLLEYDTAGEEDLIWGTGSGCGGRVQVLVAPVAPDLLAAVAARLEARGPVALATVISPGPDLGRRAAWTEGWSLGTLGSAARDAAAADLARAVLAGTQGPVAWLEADGAEVLVQRLEPPPVFLIFGAGDDAQPVARLAAACGYRVVVVDHRPAWATPERFPWAHQVVCCDADQVGDRVDIPADAACVLMTHHFFKDLAHLKLVLSRPVGYVGLLGARERTRRLLALLREEAPDLYAAARERLRAPVGLDIGADGPEQIAVAIVAEVLAVRSGRSGAPLAATRGVFAP